MSNYDFIQFLFLCIRAVCRCKKKWWRGRGLKHEELVFAAFKRRKNDQDIYVEAPWIQSVRRGTEKDERSGIDAIIETDVGPIYLQIKSSEQYAQKFRDGQKSGRYSKSIAVVIINDDGDCLSPEDVRLTVAMSVASIYRNDLDVHISKYSRSESCTINFQLALPQL